MNMNPSKYLRAVSGLFFIFTLLFSGIAQASILPRVTRSLPDISQSQKDKVFSIVESLNIRPSIKPKNLSEDEIRVLAYALDDPTSLIKSSSDGLFESNLYRAFFFSRFDLYRDGDTLFTKLFFEAGGNKELPFGKAKGNWENFIDATKGAKRTGVTQIEETDLEAAAINFIHKRFSNRYSSNIDNSDPLFVFKYFNILIEQSMGMFFHRRFTIAHYISPHYTLNTEDFYNQFIMGVILLHGSLHSGTGPLAYRLAISRMGYGVLDRLFINSEFKISINSKEFVLKTWNNIIKETNPEIQSEMMSLTVFLRLIVDSVFECRRFEWRSSGASMQSHPFLKAMVEASRENDRLTRVVDIIDNLVFQHGTDQEIEEKLMIGVVSELAL